MIKILLLFANMKRSGEGMHPQNRKRWVNQLTSINEQDKKDFDILDLDRAIEGSIAIILLHGPPNSPYQGYTFRLEYDASGIPYSPPNVRFIDVPWNPFVDQKSGKICCDILRNQWTPVQTLRTVILSISSLLCETKLPRGETGLNIQAAGEVSASYAHFVDIARQNASQHHYVQGHHYKDEEKPPAFYPQQNIQDGQFAEKKKRFVNDPANIKKLNKKKKLIKKQRKPTRKGVNQREKEDDSDSNEQQQDNSFSKHHDRK